MNSDYAIKLNLSKQYDIGTKTDVDQWIRIKNVVNTGNYSMKKEGRA